MQVVVTFNWKSNVDKMKSVALSKSTSIDDCCVSMANFAEFAFTSIIVITLHYLLLLRFVRCRRPYCSDSYYHCYLLLLVLQLFSIVMLIFIFNMLQHSILVPQSAFQHLC